MIAFARALIDESVLEYLIVNTPCRDDEFLQPLESLRGIKRVHVQRYCVHEGYGGSDECCRTSGLYPHRLNVLLMSSGEYSSIDDIPEQDTQEKEKTVTDSGKDPKRDEKFELMKHICFYPRWRIGLS